jgi:hypothetical protein
VPERGVAMSVLTKLISEKGGFEAISYKGMEADTVQIAS